LTAIGTASNVPVIAMALLDGIFIANFGLVLA
jgi:hypothetical protein